MSSRIDAVLLTLMLALSGSIVACAAPAEDGDQGGGSTPGNGGTPSPGSGTPATGGGAGSTATGGGAGSTATSGGAGSSAGTSGASGGDATVGGAGGATVGAGGAMAGGAGGVGVGGMGGMGGAAGGAAGSMAMREDLGEGDMQDVVTIGDSFMNLSLGSGVEYSLDKVTGRTYRHYAVSGTQILNGQIPGQYDDAKSDDPDIMTVVMTGGGNDVILDFLGNLLACSGAKTEAELSAACIAGLDEITVGVDALTAEMEADGVKDVVYIGYGYTTGTELGGTIERTKRVQGEKCRDDDPAKTIRCHFVDPSQQLIGMISIDGIHPTVAGYDMIAEMVWERMQAEGVRR